MIFDRFVNQRERVDNSDWAPLKTLLLVFVLLDAAPQSQSNRKTRCLGDAIRSDEPFMLHLQTSLVQKQLFNIGLPPPRLALVKPSVAF